MPASQYAVTIRLSFPPAVDGFGVKTKLPGLLRNPIVLGALAREAPGFQTTIGEYKKQGALSAWLYFNAVSDDAARATKTRLEAMIAQLRGILAQELPGVTWAVDDPKATGPGR